MIDNKEFLKWFYALQLSKGKPVNEDMAVAWYELLKDFSADQIEKAFKQCVYSPDDFPTVGKVIEMVNPIKARALLEWCEVLKCAERGITPTGTKGEIVRLLGGIDRIGYCENEYEMSKLQRNFCEIFETKVDAVRMKQLEHEKPKELNNTPS
jgi:hypothetical protein